MDWDDLEAEGAQADLVGSPGNVAVDEEAGA
jgi:hypothetical protein